MSTAVPSDHTVRSLIILQNHVQRRSLYKTITKIYEPHSLATISDLHIYATSLDKPSLKVTRMVDRNDSQGDDWLSSQRTIR
jgi:hypothetical protein